MNLNQFTQKSVEAIQAAQQLAQQGAVYAVVTLKDSAGNILYPSQVAAAAGSIEGASLDPALIASVLKENSLVPVAKLAAFRDPIAARTDRNMAIGYTGQAYLWLDNKASAGGNPWLNPYSDEAVQFIGDLIGFDPGPAARHLLILLTDASPNDSRRVPPSSENPLGHEYGGSYGVDDAAAEVRQLRQKGLRVSAVFMGEDSSIPAAERIYGKNLARIRGMDQLARAAGRLIQNEIRELGD